MDSFIEALLRIFLIAITCAVFGMGIDWLQLCFIINILYEVIIIRSKIK